MSSTLRPATIVERKSKCNFGKAMLAFGSCTLVNDSTTNTMKPRSVPDIALKRSNNAGGNYLISLYSSERIHGHKWDALPIDKHTIERVDQLTEDEKNLTMNRDIPCFE